MEKEKVKEYLDTMADAVKTLTRFRPYICSHDIHNKSLQLHKTARRFAEVMGLELHEFPWYRSDATYISFEYEGVTFFELENYTGGDNENVQ